MFTLLAIVVDEYISVPVLVLMITIAQDIALIGYMTKGLK